MAAMEPLCRLIGINLSYLTKEEIYLFEAELLRCICNELKEIFRKRYIDFFRFIKFSKDMENEMLERNFVSLIIKDILSSGEYTIEGFAEYTDTHEDVIHEVISGINTNPSAILLRRVIDLHRVVRGDLYDEIIKKIITQYLDLVVKKEKRNSDEPFDGLKKPRRVSEKFVAELVLTPP